jgi:hypothetical protein
MTTPTRTQMVQHLEAHTTPQTTHITGGQPMASFLDKIPEEDIQDVYQSLCQGSGILPMGAINTKAIKTDLQATLQNPQTTQDLVAAIQESLSLVKEKGQISLDQLHHSTITKEGVSQTNTTTLKLAFHLLMEYQATQGISPYQTDEAGQPIHSTNQTITMGPGPQLHTTKTITLIHSQNFPAFQPNATQMPFTATWDLPRKPTSILISNLQGEAAAEEAFRLSNLAGEDTQEKSLIQTAQSLSVGDTVQLHPASGKGPIQHLLCANTGWITKITPGPQKNTQDKPTISFMGTPCSIKVKTYKNGQPCLQLWSETQPVAQITTNIPHLTQNPHQICIPEDNQSETLIQSLLEADVAEKLTDQYPDIHTKITVLKITDPWTQTEINKALETHKKSQKAKTQPEMNP